MRHYFLQGLNKLPITFRKTNSKFRYELMLVAFSNLHLPVFTLSNSTNCDCHLKQFAGFKGSSDDHVMLWDKAKLC